VRIPFLDLAAQAGSAGASVAEALAEGWYVGGPRVAAFEQELARYLGPAVEVVGVGSGTDAIELALRGLGVGPGDEVITVANTCVPTVAGIEAAGATPVLVDADPETATIDPARLAAALTARTRAVVPVHLYGRPADMTSIGAFAHEHGLLLVEDAAQAHGASIGETRVGSIGHAAAFSFYPTKNLGALGDAGAIVTSLDDVADRAVKLREYGQTPDRIAHLRADQSRLDTMQAAVLHAKLPHLERWNARRRAIAERYADALRDGPVRLPAGGGEHVHHLYVVRSGERDRLRARLLERGVETLVHYPLAVHQHPAWRELERPGALRESEQAAAEVVSLPLYPQLTDDEVDAVISALLA